MDELKKCVEVLIKKATENRSGSIEALQYTQAACNAANAMAQLQSIEKNSK
jgi:hypothetical protein